MKRYIAALFAVSLTFPFLAHAEVVLEPLWSPDKAVLVMVERMSEAPNLSVSLLNKPVLNTKNTLWHQQLSSSPSDDIKVWWRNDSKAFIVQHSTKDNQIRLFAVLLAQDTIISSEIPTSQLTNIDSIVADTVVWKKNGSIEFEAVTTKGNRSLRVTWSCNLLPSGALKIADFPQSLKDAEVKNKDGILSEEKLDVVRYELAEARYKKAKLQGDTAESIAQIKKMVEIRSRSLKRIQLAVQLGASSNADLDMASERLLKVQLELAHAEGDQEKAAIYTKKLIAIAIKQFELAKRLYEIGMISKKDVADQKKKIQDLKEIPKPISPEAKLILSRLNDKCNDKIWRTQIDKIERPKTLSLEDNELISGEVSAFVSDCKERLAKHGVKVKWNSKDKLYEVDTAR